MQVGPWVVPSNQHVIFSINRLINTVTNDNMEWTKARVPTSNFNKSVNLLQQRCMRYKRELFTAILVRGLVLKRPEFVGMGSKRKKKKKKIAVSKASRIYLTIKSCLHCKGAMLVVLAHSVTIHRQRQL